MEKAFAGIAGVSCGVWVLQSCLSQQEKPWIGFPSDQPCSPTCQGAAVPAWSGGAAGLTVCQEPGRGSASGRDEQDVPTSHPCWLPSCWDSHTPWFVLGPLLFAARSDGSEPVSVSSPLWVAAFQLAAVSIAAGEAAPVASCSIPATGRDGKRESKISSRNTLVTSLCLALPHAQHRLCCSHVSAWHHAVRAGSWRWVNRKSPLQRSHGCRRNLGTLPRALHPHSK